MTDENEIISDFLNDDDDDEFDIEKFAREFEETQHSPENESDTNPSGKLFDDNPESDSDSILTAARESTGNLASPFAAKPSVVREVEDESFNVTPAAILEGMLFVGSPENRPIPAEEMSALMRGVSVEEIDELVGELNESYRISNSPFEIILEEDGYRLVLAKGYEFCRKRFYREEKAATLSQSVVDVLSLVAYLQPVTRNQIEEKKLKPCGSILNQLVRRRLIEVERKKESRKTKVYYHTTARFLDLFGIDSLEELPKSQSFDSPG